MSVAKPCIVRSPAPLISQVDLGVPVSAFSVTIGFCPTTYPKNIAAAKTRNRFFLET
jgi:hypothetical protein